MSEAQLTEQDLHEQARLHEFIRTIHVNLAFIYQKHDKNYQNLKFRTPVKNSANQDTKEVTVYWKKKNWISWAKRLKTDWKMNYLRNRRFIPNEDFHDTLPEFIQFSANQIDNTGLYAIRLLDILEQIRVNNEEKADKAQRTKSRNQQMEEANNRRLAAEAEAKKRRKIDTETILTESGLSPSELAFINKFK